MYEKLHAMKGRYVGDWERAREKYKYEIIIISISENEYDEIILLEASHINIVKWNINR